MQHPRTLLFSNVPVVSVPFAGLQKARRRRRIKQHKILPGTFFTCSGQRPGEEKANRQGD
jgi:hypothetical protein